MATDSPDSKLDIAPPNSPVAPTGKANPRAPAGGKSPQAAPAQNGGAAKAKAGAAQAKPNQPAANATGQAAAAAGGKQAPPGKKAVQRQPKQPSSALQQMEELEKVGSLSFVTLAPAWLISLIVHMVILLLFGLLVMPEKVKEQFRDLVAVAGEKTEVIEEELEMPAELPVDMELPETEAITTEPVENVTDIDPLDAIDANDAPAPEASAIALADIGQPTTANTDLLNTVGAVDGKGLAGRGDPNKRKQLAAANGGNDASEAAVAAALKWFAEHQNGDGSWNFDHRGGKCNGRCGNPGKLVKARLAATGMALLPFLGAGQTHKQGKYKETVRAGLYFLCRNMKVTPNGGDMTAGGNMYGHGICSIALCEAYAMTQDRDLAAPAQAALNFIVYAQDPTGGGWRYSPRQPGDTSAVGWQLMALKSGHLAFLEVPAIVVKRATKFLDSVQADDGSEYGYTSPGRGAATSAVGLISRMYMGWEKENPALERGVKRLAKMGPKITAKGSANMYFNYYASQVMHQYDGPDGPDWLKWNTKMRDTLVQTQSKKGHETGSWYFTGEHGSETAGRLYCTSMATMTLEVYYRYMPIYSQKSAEDSWD